MKLPRFIFLISIVTIICLIYVQLQVQIFELAYIGKREELVLTEELDRKNILMYNINLLGSTQNIGKQLLAKDSNLQFLDNNQIAYLERPTRIVTAKNLRKEESVKNKRFAFLVNLFSLKSEAQAKPIN